MSLKKIGYILIGAGVLGMFVSLFADYAGLGSGGIQAAQLLGAETGVIFVVMGYFFTLQQDGTVRLREQVGESLARFFASPLTGMLFGFLTAYLFFFILPMFLNPDMRMQYFTRYIPDKFPVGLDLQTLLDRVTTWFEIQTPYPGNIPQFYPPLTYILFSPLTLLSYRAAYQVMTFITILSYVVLTLLIPIWANPKRNHSIIFLLFVAGMFSYGLQFELERGQYNVLTVMLCLTAVYIFHFHYRFRFIAYLLFSLSVHLKVYPAIFLLMFIRDWMDWRGNARRFTGIILFNILLFFILGYRVFLDFLNAISLQVATPSWNWNGNHSIQAFVFNLMKDGYHVLAPDVLDALRPYSSLISLLLLAVFAICLLVLLVSAYRQTESGLNPYLLMACTVGALTIPTSNDYTLSFLTAPVAILWCRFPNANGFKNKYLASFLVAMASFAYASTLGPFKYKPYFLNNNFPALFMVLISITLLYLLRRKNAEPAPVSN